jgi:hypothetical protein
MGLEILLRRTARAVGARFGVLPIQRLMRDLQARGVDVRRLRALDVFGWTGERLTMRYAPLVKSIDVWEIDPTFEPALRRNVPNADVTITDSYEEIKRTDRTYDLVVVDNFHTPDEHFRLFPHIFRVLSDDAVLVLRVIGEAGGAARRAHPTLFSAEHLAERREFYGTDSPDRMTFEALAEHYRRLAEQNGFVAKWHHFVHRPELARVLPTPKTYNTLLALKLARA